MNNKTNMGNSTSNSNEWIETPLLNESGDNITNESNTNEEETPLLNEDKTKEGEETPLLNEANKDKIEPPLLIELKINVKEDEKNNSVITVIDPKPSHVYILIKDNYINICFSPNINDIYRMIKLYTDETVLKYNSHGSKYIYSDVSDGGTIYNIYEQNSNFLFSYDSLITSFSIIKVPHFRNELLNRKEYI
jgi:hypothetical protein